MLQTLPLSPELISAGILLTPLVWLMGLCLIKPPTYFQRVGIMLAIMWNIAYILIINVIAQELGWWKYAPSAHQFYGLPIELWIGWAVFWGGLLPHGFNRLPIIFPIACAFLIDIAAMPMLGNLFELGDYWLIGEVALLLGCLLPGLIIYKLTANRTRVGVRAFMQSIVWGGWCLFLVPAILLQYEGKHVLDIFVLNQTAQTLSLNAMALAMLIGYAALHEFARVGSGTPIPFDPPQRLVTTGIYAYIANPLQLSTALMYIILAVAYQSMMVLAALVAIVTFSELFVRWHHTIDIEHCFGDSWKEYKAHVRNWLPRWKPYAPQPVQVYYATDCNICQDTKSWLEKLAPCNVEFLSAQEHSSRDLERICYTHNGEFEDDGTNAVARVFERINLSFALLGCFMRLPIINRIIQMLADTCGERGKAVVRK